MHQLHRVHIYICIFSLSLSLFVRVRVCAGSSDGLQTYLQFSNKANIDAASKAIDNAFHINIVRLSREYEQVSRLDRLI